MRDQVVIATKFGFDLCRRTAARRSRQPPRDIKRVVEASLEAPAHGPIDLLYQHRVDPDVPIEDVAGAVKELIEAGQGQALRALRGRRADHPPRPRRAAGHGAPERVLALVARARGGDPADARGARDRLRPVQPARQRLPHRQDRRDRRSSTAPTSAAPSPASTPEARRRTAPSSTCSSRSRSGRTRRPRRSRSPGCSHRSRGSSRSPARPSCTVSRRTSPPPMSS